MTNKPLVPLTASVRERMKDRARVSAHRIAPPTATHMATVHQLPKPVEPAPSVAAPVVTEPEAMIKKDKSGFYTPEYKAKIVARVLKARETGSETMRSILDAEGLSDPLVYKWIERANGNAPKKKAGKKTGKKTAKAAPSNGKKRERVGDLMKVSDLMQEFLTTRERLAVLKAKLFDLL